MDSLATCLSITTDRYSSNHTFTSKPSVLCKFSYAHTSIHLRNSLKSRYSFPSIKASVDIPAGLKPGKRVETDGLSTDVRKRAMAAVDSFGGRVTIGDVSSKAGLKLDEAQKALQALAADTGGFLEMILTGFR